MWRCKTGPALFAELPAPVEEDASAARRAGEKIRAAQIHAHHFVRCRRIGHADVRHVLHRQRRAICRVDFSLTRFRANDVRLDELFRAFRHDQARSESRTFSPRKTFEATCPLFSADEWIA